RKMIIKKLTKEGNEGQLFYVGDVKIHRDRRFDLINGVLNMTMLRETDQGTYACYFESHPSVRVIHTVEVMSRPNILFHSDDEYVSQGEILTLECIVEGNPEPRITWYRSEGLLPSGKQEEEGPTLMLDGINNSITGTYTCKAENLLGTAAESVSVTSETDLVTSEKVSVTSNKEQDQKIEIEKVIMQTGWDSTLKLICTSHHGSSANFRWEKDGNPIDTSLIESENGGQESTITLPLMSSEDFGIYSCITESGLNSSKSSIYIDDQPQEAKFTSEPEGSNDTRYLLTWGSESNSPVIWYMVSIRNLLGESSELNNLGMFQNPESKAVNNSYTITHELIDLIPDTEYEVHIQVNNKFKWSEESRFNFRTARTASSEENSSASIIPIAENSPVTIIPTPLPNLEWCEWPLEMVKTECFFFSNLLESEEDSRHINTWRNAQRFCEENGGNLAKPSSLNTLAEYFNERGQNTEKYWLGGRRGSEDNAMWLSGETVRPDWIFNIREADSNCLQYRPSENRLYMGSCEENYRWICEKSDPFSQDLETNIFTEEEESDPFSQDLEANIFTEEEEVKIVDGRQDYETQPKQTVNRQHEDRISHWQQSVYEQEHGKQQYNQTQDQQLEILEQQLQQELEQQQQQQQQSKILQQQQQQIPEQQEVIQKITSNQLESQKRLKLQQKQKQNQSKNVIGEPEIRVVENAQTEQRTYEQNQNQESSKMNTSDNQGVSTTTTESVRGISLENQETSTTDKESVGEYQPLRYMCPPNFLRLGNGCYYFGSEMATWHDAHFACRDRDSQLITLETQWEDLTIRHYLNKPEFARLNRWLGGIYNWSTRRWMWGPSGEAMPYLGFLTSIPPESSRWHCVFMAPTLNYRWNHELCTTQMHFICEAPQSKIPNSEDIAYAP
ncbi:unnamed protein product, partial [Meganyctiphanes norvegica]